MNPKNPVKKIGASLLITLALMTLVYLLLPNGRSVGAAPQLQPLGTSDKALAASVRADQKRMRMALGQLPLSFEMNRGQFNPQVQFASRGAGYKAFSAVGVPNVLANPTLELHNGDGALLYTNNDWQDNPSQAADIAAAGLAPSNSLEAHLGHPSAGSLHRNPSRTR